MVEKEVKSGEHFDVIIVGGGITGAGLLKDICSNGKKVLMIDKHEFMSQTSSRSSKMLHGGIRYLESLDFNLVNEALQEKILWTKLTPKYAKRIPFILPIFKTSKYPFWFYQLGLELYDFLSEYKNGQHQIIRQDEILYYAPDILQLNLKGAGIYFDAVMNDKMIGIHVIKRALNNYQNAVALEKTSITSIKNENDQVRIKTAGENNLELTASDIVFATGPFTDQLLKDLNIPWEDKMLLSRGSHLWLKKDALNIKYPIVIQSYDDRVIFVIPHSDRILVGTTELPYSGDPAKAEITEEEINYLIDEVNFFFPGKKVDKTSIIDSYSGVRPLVKEEGKKHGKVSRTHKLFHPYQNTHVIIGGKYTTFRVMAQDTTKHIFSKNKWSYRENGFFDYL
ncbi:glycerol-3-phosphate dehydrogenase/oxidase [Bacteriovoracaceae bacterium]|nr:glycerol-3-phosphate dehydrogenase/oxidase [Bacteriovoracaceae bacterium]